MAKKRKSEKLNASRPAPNANDTPDTMDQGFETSSDDVGIVEYSQPSSSPYRTRPAILYIGPNKVEYTIPDYFLWPSPKLESFSRYQYDAHIQLPDVDEDVGHTFVHYLYTGAYQTLKQRSTSDTSKFTMEYRRSVLVYCAARSYALDGLETLAKRYMERFDTEVQIFDILDTARKVFPKLPEDEWWFQQYVKVKLAAAFEADENIFKHDQFLDAIGEVPTFDRLVVQIMAEIYTSKISSMANEATLIRSANESPVHIEDVGKELVVKRDSSPQASIPFSPVSARELTSEELAAAVIEKPDVDAPYDAESDEAESHDDDDDDDNDSECTHEEDSYSDKSYPTPQDPPPQEDEPVVEYITNEEPEPMEFPVAEIVVEDSPTQEMGTEESTELPPTALDESWSFRRVKAKKAKKAAAIMEGWPREFDLPC